MPKGIRNWTKEEEKALLTLQDIYGINRPSDISHQLKKIYGIKKKPTQVSRRFQRIDPKIDRTQFTDEQLLQAWELQKQFGFNWTLIGQQLNKSKMVVREKMICKYQVFLRKLNKVFGQERSNNKGKLRTLKSEAICLSLQLYQDTNPPQDEQYLQIQEKAKYMVELFDKMFRIQFQNDEDLFEKFKKITNRQQIQQMFEHLYLLDTMQNIAYNKNINNKQKDDDLPYYYFKKNEEKQIQKFKCVRTWEDAENLIIKKKGLGDQANDELNLTDNEISLIKDSPLFQKLFPNPQKKFLNFYNEAVASYQENKKFTYMIKENLKLHQVQKEIKVEKCEKQKQNIAVPIWKKNRNDREVNIHYDSQRFMNDFFDGFNQ